MSNIGAILPQPAKRRCADCGGLFETNNLNRVSCGHCAGSRRQPAAKKRDAGAPAAKESAAAANLALAVESLLNRVASVEAASAALQAELSATGRRLSVADAERRVLRARIQALESGRPQQDLSGIERRLGWAMNACATAFETPLQDMLSASRRRCFVRPRQAFYLLASSRTRCSLPAIGRALGCRDHTTVMTGIRRAREIINFDPGFRQRFAEAVRIFEEAEASHGDAD